MTTPCQQTSVWIAILATLVVGCREPSPPPNVATETREPVATPAVITAPPTPANPPTETPTETKATPRLSEDEMVALLVDSKLQRITPETAKARLASTSDVRESNPTSDGLRLQLDKGASHFLVSYVQGSKGDWIFGYARATVEAPNEGAATQSHDQFKTRLGERFGRPAWDQDGVVGWTIGDGAMEVSLLQRKDDKGLYLIEATLAEPQGESEE